MTDAERIKKLEEEVKKLKAEKEMSKPLLSQDAYDPVNRTINAFKFVGKTGVKLTGKLLNIPAKAIAGKLGYGAEYEALSQKAGVKLEKAGDTLAQDFARRWKSL